MVEFIIYTLNVNHGRVQLLAELLQLPHRLQLLATISAFLSSLATYCNE